MSAKITGQVWELDLTANKQLILLALADHADHEGNNVYPSVGLIAWKTGYSERQVQRLLKELVADRLLIVVEQAVGQTIKYRIDVAAGRKKEPRKVDEHPRQNVGGDYKKGGDKLSPHPRHSYVTPGGDIQVSPDPSLEPSIKEESAPALTLVEKTERIVPTPPRKPVDRVKDHPLYQAFNRGYNGKAPDPTPHSAPQHLIVLAALEKLGATEKQVEDYTRSQVMNPKRTTVYKFTYLADDLGNQRAMTLARDTKPKPKGIWAQTGAVKPDAPIGYDAATLQAQVAANRRAALAKKFRRDELNQPRIETPNAADEIKGERAS